MRIFIHSCIVLQKKRNIQELAESIKSYIVTGTQIDKNFWREYTGVQILLEGRYNKEKRVEGVRMQCGAIKNTSLDPSKSLKIVKYTYR